MKIAFYGREIQNEFLPHPQEGVLFQTIESGQKLSSDVDLLVSLGGDGTFLRTLEIVSDSNIPVLGINMGHLGFLAGNRPEFLQRLVTEFCEGHYTVRKHTVLQIEGNGWQIPCFPYALNEVYVQRSATAMLEVMVEVDGKPLATYWGDGLIVATPTGSTAYSLSAGGPVVFPDSPVWVISPVAPHNLNMRPIVLPDSACLTVCANCRFGESRLNLDNRSLTLKSGSVFTIKKAPYTLNSLVFEGNDFVSALRDKLLWGFDKRNGGIS